MFSILAHMQSHLALGSLSFYPLSIGSYLDEYQPCLPHPKVNRIISFYATVTFNICFQPISWEVYCVECVGSTRQTEQLFSRFIIHTSQIQKTNKKESKSTKKETNESHAYLHWWEKKASPINTPIRLFLTATTTWLK